MARPATESKAGYAETGGGYGPRRHPRPATRSVISRMVERRFGLQKP